MNTLFIANLNYLTPESLLRDVCEKYGPIENLVLVRDLQGKSRGYAFVEYTHEDDMKAAYAVHPFGFLICSVFVSIVLMVVS